MSHRKSWTDEMKIAILVFVVGLIMSFLVPTWQTPDEYAHFNMIGNSIGIEDFEDQIIDSVGIEQGRLEFNYDEKMNIKEQINALSVEPTYEKSEMLPKTVRIDIIKHLPATVGILLGILLGVPTFWALQLGEFFALIFYTVICYFALKIMPCKKEVLALIMLFPMSMQQAASMNYDAILLPLCYLLIAYIFYLRYEKEVIGWKEVVSVLALWMLITYIKIPYVFIILLVFITPLRKIKLKIGKIEINEMLIKKVRIPVIGVIGILGGCAIYVLRSNKWIQVVYGFVTETKRGLYLFFETGKTFTEYLMTATVGNLGWLDTPMSFSVVLLVFGIVVFFSLTMQTGVEEQKEYKLKKWDFIVILGTFLVLCLFTTLSMVNHTIMVILFGSEHVAATYDIKTALYQIPYIGGLQGRYYLPFIYLIFALLPRKLCLDSKKYKWIWIICVGLIYLYVFWLLLQRYWIG